MSENQVASTPVKSSAEALSPALKSAAKRKKKVEGRKKRSQKLKTDRAAAKAYFEGKSKRSTEKKSAFRKKKSKKK